MVKQYVTRQVFHVGNQSEERLAKQQCYIKIAQFLDSLTNVTFTVDYQLRIMDHDTNVNLRYVELTVDVRGVIN